VERKEDKNGTENDSEVTHNASNGLEFREKKGAHLESLSCKKDFYSIIIGEFS
jgi:hypothetical protein